MWNKNKIEKHPQKQLSLLVLFFLPLFLQAKYRQATATSSRPQHWASERRQEEVHSQPLTAFISACLGSVKKNHTFHKKKKKIISATIRKVSLEKWKHWDKRVTKINTDLLFFRPFTSRTCRIIHITVIMTHKQKGGAILWQMSPASLKGCFRGRRSFRSSTPRPHSAACWGFLWRWGTLALILDTSNSLPSPLPATPQSRPTWVNGLDGFIALQRPPQTDHKQGNNYDSEINICAIIFFHTTKQPSRSVLTSSGSASR